MSAEGKVVAGVLLATHVAAAGAGYYLAPRHPPLDPIIKQGGMFRVDTSEVITTTIHSLRAENKLLVLTYTGSAHVRVERTDYWLFHGIQELIVPASAGYHLDLSQLKPGDVRYVPDRKLVAIRLPMPVLGDIAFQPERATTITGGILTFSEQQVEALRKLAFAEARRAFVAMAQRPNLYQLALDNAVKDIANYIEVPLRIAGHPEIRVVATFRKADAG